MFQEIELINSQGQLLVKLMIPQFRQLPQVIIWGIRVFSQEKDNIYKECFAYQVINTNVIEKC